MAKKTFILLDCTEAERLCDQSQYHETSFLQRCKLSLHLRFCKACRDYHIINKKLSSLLKKANIQTFTEKEKATYKEQIRKVK